MSTFFTHRSLVRFFSSNGGPVSIKILYGSQTGTAMGFAQQLGKAAKRKKVDAQVIDLSDLDPKDLSGGKKRCLNVLITACFGKGEPTDNARNFHRWLMALDRERGEERDFFKSMEFCVFGLGQKKTYPERYQQVSIEMDERLRKLGATPFMPRGEGDSSEDSEADFDKWSETFWKKFLSLEGETQKFDTTISTSTSSSPSFSSSSPVTTTIESIKESAVDVCGTSSLERVSVYNVKNPYLAPVRTICELHTTLSPRSCLHLEFDIQGSDIWYTTGDYLGVFPTNDATIGRRLAKRLELDQNYKLTKNTSLPLLTSHRVFFQDQEHITLERALLHLDMLSVPRRSLLRSLAEYATDLQEKKKLLFLSSNSNVAKSDYDAWIGHEFRSFLDVLNAFPSITKIPADELVDLIPPLLPRYYSISSSSQVNPTHIHLAVSLVDFFTLTGRRHQGPTTRYLSHLKHHDKVPVFVKQSLFRLPKDPQTTIIMIAGGTGVAPFRAFLHERLYERQQGRSVGKAILYCGFNHRSLDYLYKDELKKLEEEKIVELRPAFSHENSWRYFVQHRMLMEDKEAEEIWNILHNENGSVYICGDARGLGGGVKEALCAIVESKGKLVRGEADEYLRKLTETHRLQMDVY